MTRTIKWRLSPVLACLAVIVAAGLPHLPAVRGSFVLSDSEYIGWSETEAGIRSFSSFFTGERPSLEPGVIASRPVTSLSFYIEGFLWKNDPTGYHVTNLLLHVFACVLFFFVCRFLTRRYFMPAFLASLFFASHPVHTENIAWISGRSLVLGTVFFLAAFLVFLLGEESGEPVKGKNVPKGPRSPGDFPSLLEKLPISLHLILVPLFFLLAVLSHETAWIFPFVLLVYDVFTSRDRNRDPALLKKKALRVYVPLLAILIGYLGFRFSVTGSIPFLSGGKGEGSLNPLLIPGRYTVFSLIPWSPSALHELDRPLIPGGILSVLPLLFLVPAFFLKNRPAIRFGCLFFLLGLISVLAFPPSRAFPEQDVYLASVGFCLALGGAVTLLLEYSTYTLILFFCLIFSFSLTSYRRTIQWRDERSLWTAESRIHSESPEVWNRLGKSHYMAGAVAPAEKSFRKALELDDRFYESYHNLVRLLIDGKRDKEAEMILAEAGKRGSDPAGENYSTIGSLYLELGKEKPAKGFFQKAMELNPDNPSALLERGNRLFLEGRYQEAIETFTRALGQKTGIERAGILTNRGMAYSKRGEMAAARADLEEALSLNPRLVHPYLYLAALEAEAKFPEKAAALLETAIREVPSPPFEIYFALHQIYDQFRKPNEAFEILYEYQKKNPRDIRVHMALGRYLFEWYKMHREAEDKLVGAAKCFKNAHRIDPRNTGALLWYGKTALEMNNPEAAKKIWNQVLKIDPDNAEALRLLTNIEKTDPSRD